MELICYLRSDWKPTIRPAEPTRDWMDRTRQSYAYRCLPLNIANAHGWEILSPIAFSAVWNGGPRSEDVVLDLPADVPPAECPVSIFGEAVVTFPINALFRTPAGWNLWVGGSPNRPKDAISPLTGVVETDWSPYTFTMNWRFTRRNHRVHFEVGEPICFIYPVQRSLLTTVRPRFLPLAAEPQLAAHHAAWSHSRTDFNKMLLSLTTPLPAAEQWQRRYFRGLDMTDQPVVPDHLSKLRLEPFQPAVPDEPTSMDQNAPVILQTDIATLGRVIKNVTDAIKDGDACTDLHRSAAIRQLMELGLGESEATEVFWAATDQGETGQP